jgi:multiple sugar transport system permease protein
MSLVGRVGRRRPRARVASFFLYLILCLGALTTLYPFMLMVSTGLRGASDQDDTGLVPRFLTVAESKDSLGKVDKVSLYGKYLLDKYAGDQTMVDSTRIGPAASTAEVAAYGRFLLSLAPEDFIVGFRKTTGQVTGRLDQTYQRWLRDKYGTVDEANRAYIDENISFATLEPPNELLDRKSWPQPKDRKYLEWLEFKRSLPAEFRVPLRAQRMFQEFLRSKYKNQIAQVPAAELGSAKSFEQILLPSSGALLVEFQAKSLPARYLGNTIEDRWAKVSKGPLPIDAYERRFVTANASRIRREFAWRNYGYVLDYIVIHGHALWNTLIFCFLAILSQLIINPLAAYALSRYPIRATGKILLFLLATMAFPAEVALIPSFLLLKSLGLLNTFAALVLPGAASGYMIFLLKGFFDSLPPELFEAGQIDGAKESTMMLRIALPLSKPVLGYLALLAFMGAYGSFIYAFLVAQDQKIWTLMVFIYNLQTYAPKAVTMAALCVAALPTLIVFLFAQRVIMKGIILPGEK